MFLLEKSVVILDLINRLNEKIFVSTDCHKVLDNIYITDENTDGTDEED